MSAARIKRRKTVAAKTKSKLLAAKRRRANVTPSQQKSAPSPSLPFLPPTPGFLIVGIGASAGGLEAMEDFFRHMPPSSGMAFVVVSHQHAGHVSLLPGLLGKCTAMPVVEATDGLMVGPDHVYLAPGGDQSGHDSRNLASCRRRKRIWRGRSATTSGSASHAGVGEGRAVAQRAAVCFASQDRCRIGRGGAQ